MKAHVAFSVVVTGRQPILTDEVVYTHACPEEWGDHPDTQCRFRGIRPCMVTDQFETKEDMLARVTEAAGKVWDRWQEAHRKGDA